MEKFRQERDRSKEAGRRTLDAIRNGEILVSDAYGAGPKYDPPKKARRKKIRKLNLIQSSNPMKALPAARDQSHRTQGTQSAEKSPAKPAKKIQQSSPQRRSSRVPPSSFPADMPLIDRRDVRDCRKSHTGDVVSAVIEHVRRFVIYYRSKDRDYRLHRGAWWTKLTVGNARVVVLTYSVGGPTKVMEANRFEEPSRSAVRTTGKQGRPSTGDGLARRHPR